MKSPTNKLGFIDPEGILKGSAINDLINKAINMAIIIDLIFPKKLLFFDLNIDSYICNSIFFFIGK